MNLKDYGPGPLRIRFDEESAESFFNKLGFDVKYDHDNPNVQYITTPSQGIVDKRVHVIGTEIR